MDIGLSVAQPPDPGELRDDVEVASQSEVKMLQNNNIFVLHFPVQSSKIKNIMTLVSHYSCQGVFF